MRDLERRASQIRDPIDRLRYLRQASLGLRAPRRRKTFRGARAALFAVAALIPFHPVSDASVHSGISTRVEAAAAPAPVWLVESTAGWDLYSNGLRIEKRFAADGPVRSWRPVPLGGGPAGARQSRPAGIVFHATESQQVPFDADHNHSLKTIGEDMLDYVRNRRAYHFVIDRFGRVYGVVPEEQAANHAGHSVWADGRRIYLNLNQSFVGVSFEARTATQMRPALSSAQIAAGRMLTGMLRAKYGIAAENCVTHAQVSVNPGNMRLGWHTDWMEDFPFAELGLRDNYSHPLAAVYLFGFSSDTSYQSSRNAALRRAVAESEARLRERAEEEGSSIAGCRQALKRNYQQALALAGASTIEGVNHERH
jgi:hypothetical protein